MKITFRNTLISTAALLALSAMGCAPQGEAEKNEMSATEIALIHDAVLTLDTHVDIPLNYMTEIDPSGATELQVDLGKLETGGLDAAFFIVYTPQGELTDEGYAAASEIAQTRIKAIHEMAKANKDRISIALNADDVRDSVSAGKLAALIGVENAYPLGYTCDVRFRLNPDLGQDCIDYDVMYWAQQGVRYMGITHFGHNQFGDSSNPHPDRDDGPRHNGLSELGRELVLAMNDNGIMVDVSHAGKETMMQAADLSRTPIIASHSGVKAVADTARNLDDEQLLKLKEVGGVAQMVALGAYVKLLTPEQEAFRETVRTELGLETDEARSAMSDEQEVEYEKRVEAMYDIEPRATVADFADHIDHAVKVAGIDHVGIASDFDGGGGIVGWQDATETQNVTAELIKRGYSEEDIAKIWGGNLLRVLDAVQAGMK